MICTAVGDEPDIFSLKSVVGKVLMFGDLAGTAPLEKECKAGHW